MPADRPVARVREPCRRRRRNNLRLHAAAGAAMRNAGNYGLSGARSVSCARPCAKTARRAVMASWGGDRAIGYEAAPSGELEGNEHVRECHCCATVGTESLPERL